MKRPKTYFFVVDAGRARLLECSRVQANRVHVCQHEMLEDRAEEHEHGRPSPRSGKGGNTYASGGHEDEQRLHRFAKEVSGWMDRRIARFESDAVPLFAAPRFLGELRKLYSPALAARVQEHPADLTQLTEAALARHRSVIALLPD